MIVHVCEDVAIGVMGLVASRLAERFNRPAAVLRPEGDSLRGSARSIPAFNVMRALDELAPMLERYGGHARAAGFSLASIHLPRFANSLRAIAASQLREVDLRPELRIAAEVGGAGLTWDLAADLEALGPFGEGNPSPVLLWRGAEIAHARRVGSDGRHLALKLSPGPRQAPFDAIAFGRGADEPTPGSRLDLAFALERDEWRGRARLRLRVEDMVSSGY
jgi:single-stranded-DNA-specific exonuclease